MRHNRRAVMAEHYKLYMKKNVFNGRYFVRNMQIVFCALIVFALIFTVVMLSGSNNAGNDTAGVDRDINVKEALFGNNEVTEAEIIASTEAVMAVADEAVIQEEATTEAVEVLSEITAEVNINSEVNDIEKTVNAGNTVGAENQAAADDVPNTGITDNTDIVVKSEFENRCIADVEETLNVRKEPSTDSEFVGSMSKGSIATVEGNEGEWTKIKSGDVEGYVLSEYVLTGKEAEEFSKDYVTIQGTALEDGINIRKERSTESEILKVLDKDDTISVIEVPREESEEKAVEKSTAEVTEETTENNNVESTENNTEETTENNTSKDNINWLTVMLDDGQIGYVSQDYVNVDKLYTLAVSAEELQRREEERLASERAAAEAARIAEQQAAQQASTQAASASTSSDNNSSTSYHGEKTTPVTATESGESLGKFYITAYCGCSKCSGGHNKTASGTTPAQGRTIAADTSILPFGTQVVIDGVVYTVEDRGSGVSGNHIDIFFATHEDALAFGSKTVTVYKY